MSLYGNYGGGAGAPPPPAGVYSGGHQGSAPGGPPPVGGAPGGGPMYNAGPAAGGSPPPSGGGSLYGGAPGGGSLYGSGAPPSTGYHPGPPPPAGGYGAPAPSGPYGAPPQPGAGSYGGGPAGGSLYSGGGGAPAPAAPGAAPYGGGRGGYGGGGYGGYGDRDGGDYKRPFHHGGQHVLGRDRCPFYTKMGSCRHSDRCTKVHEKPTASSTIILPMMYPNPKVVPLYATKHGKEVPLEYDKKYLRKHIEDFYEDVFCTLMEFGRIVEMRVVDNLCEHLLGNVYVKFENEVAAQNAVDGLDGKMYNGVLLLPELCPVHEFADAICKEVEDVSCKRGIQCNYWHPTPFPKPNSSLLRDLARAQEKHWEKIEKRAPQRTSPPRGGGDTQNPSHHHQQQQPPAPYQQQQPLAPYQQQQPPMQQQGGAYYGRDRSPPMRRSPRRERSPDGVGRVCHICARPGHISKDCPMKD